MLKNVYAPLSGGVLQEKVIDIISNNLANVNTTAFKEDEISFAEKKADPWPSYATPHPPAPFKTDMSELNPLRGNEMSYVALSEIKTSHSQGSLQRTSNESDMAIEGDGFFEVTTPFGERLTRDGGFNVNNDGYLVTKNGYMVQGENGPISGLHADSLKVLPTGEIYSGKQFIDKIKISVVTDKNSLERLGQNLWIHNGAPDNLAKFTGRVEQGYLEASNVNPMKNLTNLIIAHRTYEALQKSVKSQDETMQNANKISEL